MQLARLTLKGMQTYQLSSKQRLGVMSPVSFVHTAAVPLPASTTAQVSVAILATDLINNFHQLVCACPSCSSHTQLCVSLVCHLKELITTSCCVEMTTHVQLTQAE